MYCPYCGQKLTSSKYDEKTSQWFIDCGTHKAWITVTGEAALTQGLAALFEQKPRQVLCPDCYNYSMSRSGRVCGYFGTYNPHEYECRAYKPNPYKAKRGSDKPKDKDDYPNNDSDFLTAA
jgi:hypothetical protein